MCSYGGGINVIAQACHERGLKIPDDVELIGADDPGDVIVSSMGCTLSVLRPDYLTLSKTVRQILDGEITAKPGTIINSPMKLIYRESTAKEL